MASFRVHEDHEKRGFSDLRQKQANMAPLQQKRSVLATLQNQASRQIQPKGKQPLGHGVSRFNKENVCNKTVNLKQAPPVVPVAQFEAFNVYEDTKENDAALTQNASNVCKGSDNEFVNTKKDWFLQETKIKQEQVSKTIEITQKEMDNKNKENEHLEKGIETEENKTDTSTSEDAMSIEKSLTQERNKEKGMVIRGGKLSRERFFELEEYRADIYTYLRELEMHNRPKPGYMRKQPDITYNMRTILVDWLVEVAQEYKLQSETLFLAVNYTDRFLSYMSVVRGKLQLVGTAAMFIAAKYEEIYPPDVREFVYITDDTYTKKQVIRMEHLILKVLSFDLSVPTPLTFITAIAIAGRMPEKVIYLAMYLSELAMLETDSYLETLPSVLAASAIAVARYTLQLESWNLDLKRKTGYDAKDLKKSMEFLYVLFCKAPTHAHQAIREKFSSSQYLHVSQLHPRSDDVKLE